jgi:hypothetical protein
MASTKCGQNALLELPSSAKPQEGSITSYKLDFNLEGQRKSLSSSNDSGVEVLKVSKVSVLFFFTCLSGC